MRLARHLNLNISVSQWDEPFSHWLSTVDIVVTPPSTSLYDAFFNQKQVLVIDSIEPKRRQHLLTESDDNNQILRAACRPKSVAEVIETINSGNIQMDQKIVQQCLHDQVSTEHARNSILNILNCVNMLKPRIIGSNKRLRYIKAQAFSITIIIISSCLWINSCLTRKSELGSTFLLDA